MARVRKLSKRRSNSKPHPTEVDAEWSVIETETGVKLLQISTFGSDTRVSQPKVSQTLQFDRDTAQELISVLGQVFGSAR